MIDIDHQIRAVQRRVGTRVLDAGEARVMTVTRTYAADVEDVWDACTDPQRLPRWFLPVTGDLHPGGRYQFEGNAGGTVERCDRPTSFAATWEFGGEVSWVEVRLTPDGTGTRFELEHVAHVDDERWAQFGPGAVGVGWDLALLGLGLHLDGGGGRGGGTVEVAAFADWSTSDDGLRFATEVSASWRDASIAAGTDPNEATAAGDRTTAFYTGATPEPEPGGGTDAPPG